MEIIDKSTRVPVTEYAVGDVIQDGGSAYMVVQSLNGNYYMVNLGDGTIGASCDSLKKLYYGAHTNGQRKVKATVVIEGEEN